MSDDKKSVSEIRVQNPLTSVTRKERRNLLIASFVGLIEVITGLFPTKINSFGIEFSTTQKESIMALMSFLIFYFLFTFIIYAASDFVAWRISFHATRLYHLENFSKYKISETEEKNKVVRKLWNWTKVSFPVSASRVFLEFIFPIAIGLYTAIKILLLIRK